MAATLWKEYKTVRVEKEDGTTWCILNRPEKRNAMNPQLHYDMLEALTELEVDKETQVLVITGAGPSWWKIVVAGSFFERWIIGASRPRS